MSRRFHSIGPGRCHPVHWIGARGSGLNAGAGGEVGEQCPKAVDGKPSGVTELCDRCKGVIFVVSAQIQEQSHRTDTSRPVFGWRLRTG